MGAIQGFFATAGPGALIGAALGWWLFNEHAAPVANCAAVDPGACTELVGLPFLPFVTAVAALGGLIGALVQLIRGELF